MLDWLLRMETRARSPVGRGHGRPRARRKRPAVRPAAHRSRRPRRRLLAGTRGDGRPGVDPGHRRRLGVVHGRERHEAADVRRPQWRLATTVCTSTASTRTRAPSPPSPCCPPSNGPAASPASCERAPRRHRDRHQARSHQGPRTLLRARTRRPRPRRISRRRCAWTACWPSPKPPSNVRWPMWRSAAATTTERSTPCSTRHADMVLSRVDSAVGTVRREDSPARCHVHARGLHRGGCACATRPSCCIRNSPSSSSVDFILSVRGIGEGHRSSIGFRTGNVTDDGTVTMHTPGPYPEVPHRLSRPAPPLGLPRSVRRARRRPGEHLVHPR